MVAVKGVGCTPGGGIKRPDLRPGSLPPCHHTRCLPSFSCPHTALTTLILQIRTQTQSPITAQCLQYAAPSPLNPEAALIQPSLEARQRLLGMQRPKSRSPPRCPMANYQPRVGQQNPADFWAQHHR